jgi:peptidyl-prolyl cis-trans isomerase C
MSSEKTPWYKEPLVHFLLLGALLFAVNAVVSGNDSEDLERVDVSRQNIKWLTSAWQRQWRRPPTASELDGLIANHIREEILYREAVAMGLDSDDTIVRRRMVQKLEFLTEDLVNQLEPSEEQLLEHFEGHPEDYQDPELRSFSHIFFSTDERGGGAGAEATRVLEELRARSSPPERAPELGDRFMMQYDYPRRTEEEVARHMGTAFARALFGVEPGGWGGPLESGYGLHLVRVSEIQDGRPLQFSEVREQVRDEVMRVQREVANEAFYEGLKSRYEIVIEDDLAESPVED